MRTTISIHDIEMMLDERIALLLKHSPRCPVSRMAYRECERYDDNKSGVPIYVVNVIGRKPLSEHISAITGITHESPQAILFRDGTPVWTASHTAITYDAILGAVKTLSSREE